MFQPKRNVKLSFIYNQFPSFSFIFTFLQTQKCRKYKLVNSSLQRSATEKIIIIIKKQVNIATGLTSLSPLATITAIF